MRILFLSDIHLGSPLFKGEDMIESLLYDTYNYVIINGDILDTWEAPLSVLIRNNEAFINRLNEIEKLVIVRGNHDPSINELRIAFPDAALVSECLTIEDGDFRIKVRHGHEYDDLILKHYWLAKMFFPFQWVSSRFGVNLKGWIRDLLHSIAVKKHDPQYGDLIYDIEKRAVKEAMEEGCHSVVLGHTHMPKITLGECIYVNIGDWISHTTYVVYDNGEFYLRGMRNELVQF